MDYIDDQALIADLKRFANELYYISPARFYALIARAVEAGMEAERRMSNPDDIRYHQA